MEVINKEALRRKKANLGSGRLKHSDYCNLDITQFVDNNKDNTVDVVIDVEKEGLPFENSSLDEIKAENIFEHLGEGFIFALNECHRVLGEGGILEGCVPVAGSNKDFKDITHKRHFIKESFSYLTGSNPAKPDRPGHPKYADYGVLPWNEVSLKQEDDMIWFKLSPRKV